MALPIKLSAIRVAPHDHYIVKMIVQRDRTKAKFEVELPVGRRRSSRDGKSTPIENLKHRATQEVIRLCADLAEQPELPSSIFEQAKEELERQPT